MELRLILMVSFSWFLILLFLWVRTVLRVPEWVMGWFRGAVIKRVLSLRDVAIRMGLFGLGETRSPHLFKGSEGDKYSRFVSRFVEIEQDIGGYVGCEDGLRGGVKGVDSLAVVTHTDDDNGGSELLDIQPGSVGGKNRGKFCHVVGLSCAGYEDKLIALFTTIEANRSHNGVGHVTDLSAKFRNRGQREVKRLECSLNYDIKGGQSSTG
jgi:hypothetical protein